MNKIKLIILDFHGVLLNGDMSLVSKWLAKKHNTPWRKIYAIIYLKYFNQAALRKISENDVFKKTVEYFGWRDDWKKVRRYHVEAMKLNKQVFNLGIRLQKQGYQILLLSKNTPPQFREYLKKFNIRKYYPNIINTYNLNLPKANRKTLEIIFKKFHLGPNAAIIIDDQASNLIEAKKMKVNTILYKSFPQFNKDINNLLK